MISICRMPDRISVSCGKINGEEKGDAVAELSVNGSMTFVRLTARESRPEFITLRWEGRTDSAVSVLGDAWERGYGNLAWGPVNPAVYMPWYFLVKHDDAVTGYGVMTLPNAMASWRYDDRGITLLLDVRCGGTGVCLNGRTLEVCTVVCASYHGLTAFEAASFFCKLMSPMPRLPAKPVYGGNNWYYAYGKSSFEDIVADASLQTRLAQGLKNRPFMVIDDGWQINPCAGPWLPNESFRDMKKLADEIKALDVRPGIWVRYLRDESPDIPPRMRLNKKHLDDNSPELRFAMLDPSSPEVLDAVRGVTRRLVDDWGYELIKHDFSTVDIFGKWGFERNELITDGTWSFADTGKTSAEIVKNFYKAISDAADGRALILGCNCIGHLLSGLAEINRTGNDTSGTSWASTRKNGVNTLAFRLCQNKSFFAADADCVGIIPGKIDEGLNKEWATLLAHSGSPFFISAAEGSLTGELFEYYKGLYETASLGGMSVEPVDWEYNVIPSVYSENGKIREYNWYE